MVALNFHFTKGNGNFLNESPGDTRNGFQILFTCRQKCNGKMNHVTKKKFACKCLSFWPFEVLEVDESRRDPELSN